MTMQTFSGTDYIKIDIASAYGLDKESWDLRLAWFEQNKDQLHIKIKEADEPARFYAGAKALDEVEAGEPIGFMISLDATSSGLQILAALTGDRSAAEICNIVDTGHREDAYTAVYMEMLLRSKTTPKLDRAMTKEAIMTSLYGSKAVPKRVFGEGELLDIFYDTMWDMTPACWELNEAILTAWNPEALSHDWILPDNFHVHTKVMDRITESVNFFEEPFDISYHVNQPTPEGRSLGANMIHSLDGMIVRELSRRCDYDPLNIARIRKLIAEAPLTTSKTSSVSILDDEALSDNDRIVLTLWHHYQQSGYLSARVLDHLDANNIGHVNALVIEDLLNTMPIKPFKVVSVHDCFRCLPHYGDELRFQYNWQLHLIAKSKMLQFLISQIVGHTVNIAQLDPTLHHDIPAADYALS